MTCRLKVAKIVPIGGLLENLFFASSSELKDHLTRNMVGSIGVSCRPKITQIVQIGKLKLRPSWPSWKSILNFFCGIERTIDSKFIGSIDVTCRSTVAKIILIGNPRWLPSCLCLLYFPATVLFTCIKSWFFRNLLGQLPPNFTLILLVKCDWEFVQMITIHWLSCHIYSSSKLRTA